MIENLIIIVPTHNRQHYLKRVMKYYSSFPCKVYICDSSKEKAEIENTGNILYRWVPQSNFYGKVLDVIEEISADFYALSPDDDFLKEETLIECYSQLKQDENYSVGVGKQIFFDAPFDGTFYVKPGANKFENLVGTAIEPKTDYIKHFWNNYQNILWSLFRREVIYDAFTCLLKCGFNNGNFVELMLGIEGLRHGKVYISQNGLNYREAIEGEHWGSTTLDISIPNIRKTPSLKNDIRIFYEYHSNDSGFAAKCLSYYLEASAPKDLKGIIKNFLPEQTKIFLKKTFPFLNRECKEIYTDKEMAERIGNALANLRENV